MRKTLIISTLLLLANAATAQELLGTEGSWKIYSLKQDNKKICYLASTPTKSSGTFKKRADPYFLVTQKGKDQAEVSASSGFAYQKETDVHITLNTKTKFRLFTQDALSWARDAKTDNGIVNAMTKASTMTVRGTSKKSTFAEDTYSLKGFEKALQKLKSSCQ